MAEAATGDALQEGVFLEILQNSHLCQSLFFNKVAGQPFFTKERLNIETQFSKKTKENQTMNLLLKDDTWL